MSWKRLTPAMKKRPIECVSCGWEGTRETATYLPDSGGEKTLACPKCGGSHIVEICRKA